MDNNQFIANLKKNPLISAVLLFGSYARGDNKKDSDVDLLVIVESGKAERKIEKKDGNTFEMIWVTESDAIKHWKTDKDGCYSVWQDVKVIFDKTGATKRLRKEAEKIIAKGKKELTKSELAHKKYDAEDQIRAIQKLSETDELAARYALAVVVSKLVESFFDIKSSWSPPPKKRLQAIRKVDQKVGKLFDDYYSNSKGLDQSVEIAARIIQTLFSK